VQVCDTGRGISADALPKIFNPFFTTRSEGTGLGLSLANNIVQSHGGYIDRNQHPGHRLAIQSLVALAASSENSLAALSS
jgi:two-component system, LuxR family, sensor kinase FixL